MSVRKWIVFSILLITAAAVNLAQEKGGEEETGPYDVVQNWPQQFPGHEGWTWGSTGGVFAETPNKVFVIQRGELPIPGDVKPGPDAIFGAPGRQATTGTDKIRWEHTILIVDRNGKIVDSWTQWDKMWAGGRGPHKIKINPYDPEKHVWIVDDNLHQIYKFTNDGKKLVLTLGERLKQGQDEKHFGRPTDIAWLPDGTFFISDGYINTRVVKFDRNGKYLMAWGKPGTGPGEFNLPHSIAVDAKRRVYVADRSNSRIQIFDENGKYLDEWKNIRMPFHIEVSSDQNLWVSDGATMKILKYDLNGRLQNHWGTWGQFRGAMWGVHQFSVDQEGNLYIAEVYNGRSQKFRPKPNADKARLIAPARPLASSN
jgi:DNA-binding beta-propeller fold protein YncE